MSCDFLVSADMWAVFEAKGVSARGQALWLRAGSYCCQQLTDGHLKRRELSLIRGTLAAAEELVSAELWDRDGTGFVFKSWSDSQATRAQVEAQRKRWKEAKSRVSADFPARIPASLPTSSVVSPSLLKNSSLFSEELREAKKPKKADPLAAQIVAGYTSRFEDKFHLAPGGKLSTGAKSIAAWCVKSSGQQQLEPSALAERLLDGFFATSDRRTAEARFPMSWLANNPAQYLIRLAAAANGGGARAMREF